MSKFYLRNLLLSAALLLVAPTGASAQNAMASNIESATVMNGVTMAQLQAIFSKTKFNSEDFVVASRQTSAGTPYLAVTAPSLPFTIYISAFGEDYSGQGDGVYAGAAMFTSMTIPSFGEADVHDFNRQYKVSKLAPVQNGFVYSVELLAAGGVTEEAILNGLIPFFNGITGILKMATTETVSFDAPESYARIDGQNVIASPGALSGAAKLNNTASNPGAERLIESFADDMAR